MKWYDSYLAVFEKPFASVPEETVLKVKYLLKNKRSHTPVVSVVLIAHNEANRILSCLWSLAENQCSFPFEILVVNNRSTDATAKVLKTLGATVFNEPRKGPGYARQCGLNHAKGKFHLCIDADTMYPPHYIETHVKTLMKPGVVCVFGLWSFIPTRNYSRLSLWSYEFFRDMYLRIQAINRPELCVRGMVLSFRTDVARNVGFRTTIIRGEDGSMAFALKPYGKLIFLTSRKGRVLTSNSTLHSEGSLLKSVGTRLSIVFKNAGGVFYKKEKYEDKDSNLMNIRK